MTPRLMALDLDGTLLTTDKRLSTANRAALHEMSAAGMVVALASGRLGSSMSQYLDQLNGITLAMLTLNGAAVYAGTIDHRHLVYQAGLPSPYADTLIEFARDREFALNYYADNVLSTVRNAHTAPWIDLYIRQTGTPYQYLDSLDRFCGASPSKIIFVGEPAQLDDIEAEFRSRWSREVYIVRTWDYYLEFLNVDANKGNGLAALAQHYGYTLSDVVAFGDADNDAPMLERAGLSIAMKNATRLARTVSTRVSDWTNDEDAVAREWERIRGETGETQR